jgi:Tol biopolymer transport system component
MAQKIITIILGLAIVAALAWYINKNYIKSGVSIQVNTTQTPGAKTSTAPTENLVYVNVGAANEIWEVNSLNKTKKIFTDADETDKLMTFSNIATQTSEVLVATSGSGARIGGLEIINLLTAKTRKIKTDFAVPDFLAFSADSKKFAYTSFSNVEANYGFTLYYEEISGQPIKVLSNETAIITPAWSPSSTKLVYAVTSGSKTDLSIYTLSSKVKQPLVSLDGKTVDWISWPSADQILVSTRKIGDNSAGEIDGISVSTGATEKIVEFSGGRASYAYENKTGSKLAFIVAQYKDKIDSQTAGQIYVVDLSNKKKNSLEKGNQILGWLTD